MAKSRAPRRRSSKVARGGRMMTLTRAWKAALTSGPASAKPRSGSESPSSSDLAALAASSSSESSESSEESRSSRTREPLLATRCLACSRQLLTSRSAGVAEEFGASGEASGMFEMVTKGRSGPSKAPAGGGAHSGPVEPPLQSTPQTRSRERAAATDETPASLSYSPRSTPPRRSARSSAIASRREAQSADHQLAVAAGVSKRSATDCVADDSEAAASGLRLPRRNSRTQGASRRTWRTVAR
mmetsp:Transcript_7801/g.23867  ORF Transcript_7801/g.23867 Transcript_7801/m.23867 type:complete len:243 (-) Transcript_7801:281-1009(-)